MATLSSVIMTAIFVAQGVPDKTIINNIQFQNISQCRVFMSQELKTISEIVGMDMVDGIWRAYPEKWILLEQNTNSIATKSGRFTIKIRCLEVFE